MRPLSATECITPAIDRTRHLLFSNFRMGRSWKLSATSYVCRFGSMYLPFPLLYLALIPAFRGTGGSFIVIMAASVIAGLALYTWLFHLCSRLQFAYFDMVANRGEFVAPAWRKYRNQALSWTGFKIVLGVMCTAILAVPMTAFVRHLVPVFAQMKKQHGGHVDPQFTRAIVEVCGGYGLLMLALLAGMVIFGLLSDFVLPSLALEDTGTKEAFRRMGVLIRQEPGEFALYVLLKTVLGAAGYIGALLAWEIAFALISLIVGGILLLVGVGLHAAGMPSLLLSVAGVLLLCLWYVFALYTLAFVIGPIMTWMDAYAIYFVGGRYPMLGDLLDRSTPPPAAPVFNPYAAAYPPPISPTT